MNSCSYINIYLGVASPKKVVRTLALC